MRFFWKIHSIFQLTTSQGGRPNAFSCMSMRSILSTHDLTRRSTIAFSNTVCGTDLSTHDLTRRSTLLFLFLNPLYCSFNSRPHKEVDVTAWESMVLFRPFNSRPHKEVDLTESVICDVVHIFQLTTSQGGRLIQPAPLFITGDFQLTTSQGGRHYFDKDGYAVRNLSTHDLTRRSTADVILVEMGCILSTHDLTRRSTLHSVHNSDQLATFQLTTSQGGRL